MLDRTKLQSPDTLTGRVRAEDEDGLDSIWVTSSGDTLAQDGFFDLVFVSRFRFNVAAGLPPGTVVPVRLEARDVPGFTSAVDTFAVVVP